MIYLKKRYLYIFVRKRVNLQGEVNVLLPVNIKGIESPKNPGPSEDDKQFIHGNQGILCFQIWVGVSTNSGMLECGGISCQEGKHKKMMKPSCKKTSQNMTIFFLGGVLFLNKCTFELFHNNRLTILNLPGIPDPSAPVEFPRE